MTERNQPNNTFIALRRRAEALLRDRARHVEHVSAEDFLNLLNELEIHQIELELQNEELRAAQRDLEQSRRQYADLYEFAPVGYLTLDESGVIHAINLTGAAMLGYEREQVLQRPVVIFIATEDRDTFQHYRQRLFAAQTTQSVELRMKRQHDAPFWARLEGVPETDTNGDRTARLCQITFSDISARKQAEADALALKLEQEKVAILKNFIGDVSHDLRTPLSVLKTSSYLLRRQTDEDNRQRQLDILEAQITRLEKTLEGLLSMARLDQETEFDFEMLNANALVRRVIDLHETMAHEQGHTLATALSDPAPRVWGDRLHLERALANLVVNALTYMPDPGTVRLRTGTGHAHTFIEVQDTGIGIQDDELPHIFERFFRGELARPMNRGGTGLGLAIAHKVIDAHQGRIAVESEPGRGSVFRLELPRGPRPASAGR